MLTNDDFGDIIYKIEIYWLFEVDKRKTCQFPKAKDKENYHDRDDEVRRF